MNCLELFGYNHPTTGWKFLLFAKPLDICIHYKVVKQLIQISQELQAWENLSYFTTIKFKDSPKQLVPISTISH